MLLPLSLYLRLFLGGYAALAAPAQRRAVIAHDAVVGFPQIVPGGMLGQLYLKYKPFLNVVNGCVPFPAVQADGDTGGGLKPTGSSNGGCSNSTGQVYSRAGSSGNRFAIMYAWYMPKDEPSTGIGHRHDWENAVVWLSDNSTTATLLGVAASAHGGYQTTTNPSLSNGHPLIGYESFYPLDHQLTLTSTVGGMQPLITWETLTDAARTALSGTDFGSATVPFKDSTFLGNMGKAAL